MSAKIFLGVVVFIGGPLAIWFACHHFTLTPRDEAAPVDVTAIRKAGLVIQLLCNEIERLREELAAEKRRVERVRLALVEETFRCACGHLDCDREGVQIEVLAGALTDEAAK